MIVPLFIKLASKFASLETFIVPSFVKSLVKVALFVTSRFPVNVSVPLFWKSSQSTEFEPKSKLPLFSILPQVIIMPLPETVTVPLFVKAFVTVISKSILIETPSSTTKEAKSFVFLVEKSTELVAGARIML